MKLEDVLIEEKRTLPAIISGIVDMFSFDISIGIGRDKFAVNYMDSYLEQENVQDQSGDLYSASESSRNKKIALALASLSLAVFAFIYGPSVYYSIRAYLGVDNTTKNILETAQKSVPEVKAAATKQQEEYIPAYDATLPEENMLSIPTAGIETKIHEAIYENHEDALRKGVWRVSYTGTPADNETIILTAHRYGYLKWSIPYRLKNSFYNLPKAELGDRVEIVWRQRKYVYEIYAEEEGEGISDYDADLILYTCKDLKSPIRIFKYARLVKDN